MQPMKDILPEADFHTIFLCVDVSVCVTSVLCSCISLSEYERTHIQVYYSASDREAEYWDERVCLCVCLSMIMSLELLHVRFSPNFLCMLPMAVARSYCGGTTFHLLKLTFQVAAPGAESAICDFLVVVIVVVINGSVSVPFCGTETLWITLSRRTPASSP